MDKRLYEEYCTGCGLCCSITNQQLEYDSKGFPKVHIDEQYEQLYKTVCPCSGNASKKISQTSMWGKSEAVYVGWATDKSIRYHASSGGILTAICCYLLDEQIVDGVIQTKKDDKICYLTKTVVSKTTEEVKNCAGSRYTVSSPLKDLDNLIDAGKKYAFVGKPCDVSALRMYMENNKELSEQIPYLFSFFCAGTPSGDAELKLLSALGVNNKDDCVNLTYRGNGWPGFAVATRKDGTTTSISYNDSWGQILGRDVRKSCRFCIDGVGEFADIACGDAWYLNSDENPEFTEKDGRNVIFIRTERGMKLFRSIENANIVFSEDYSLRIGELKHSQKHQYERKASMRAMIFGMQIVGKKSPKYDKKVLAAFAKNVSFKLRVRRMLGTVKRALDGKI